MKKYRKYGLLLAVFLISTVTGCSKNKAVETTTVPESASVQETQATTQTETKETTTEAPTTETETQETIETTAAAGSEVRYKKLLVASDLHYLASELTDQGEAFQYMVEHGDGKLTNYIWQITDAFISEVKKEDPKALIIAGDLTMNGAKKSHKELASKLQKIEDAGIPVIVIPGNHDINCNSAASYFGNTRTPEDKTSAEDFETIYADFGYNEAISRDKETLSYVYQLDNYNRLLMLDTCQYKNKSKVGGMIDTDTYYWIEEQLDDAWENGMNVIPVAHHNLLDESNVYVDDCTIEHPEDLIDLLEGSKVNVFLSGHLHVQHYKYTDHGKDSICEIVTSSLSTPPCQYGIFRYADEGSFKYDTQKIDIEKWARKKEIKNTDLRKFTEYAEPFLEKIFYNQSYDVLTKLAVEENTKKQMSEYYAKLFAYTTSGEGYQIVDEAKKDPAYKLWEEYGFDTVLYEYIEEMIADAVVDYNHVERN